MDSLSTSDKLKILLVRLLDCLTLMIVSTTDLSEVLYQSQQTILQLPALQHRRSVRILQLVLELSRQETREETNHVTGADV